MLGTMLILAGCDPVPQMEDDSAGLAPLEASGPELFTCPMHPSFLSTDAAAACPICGMDLVPAAADRAGDTVAVEPAMIQTMGIRTQAARVTTFGRSVRAFGTVEIDERLEAVSTSRLEGWIRDLQVRAVGDPVLPGQALYRIYSPALISAQKDYLMARDQGDPRRIEAVRQRLLSLGLQAQAIGELARGSALVEALPVYAEAPGTVTELNVREGDYLKAGDGVMRMQSFEQVWVMARIAEQDLPLVRTGLPVTLDFPSAPEAPGAGLIDYVYPTIDSSTRTGRVRIEVDNTAGLLRPGAYADISIALPGEPRLSIPTEAILRDSRGEHVIVAVSPGRFAPRTLETGLSADGRTEILKGLAAGELVVASGQFLLDSEVNLREGLSRFGSQTEAPESDAAGVPDPHAGHQH